MVRKSLFLAVLAIVGLLTFSLAQTEAAVVDGLFSGTSMTNAPVDIYVNPGGTGQALVYGYYNARNALSFFKVVNTSETSGISAKVRFREGKNSNEVLDFFICLSAADQFTGWVVGDANTGNPASIVWWDNDTPTFPDPNSNNVTSDNFTGINNTLMSVPFHYSSTGAVPSVTADDTKEGYFEIISVNSWTDSPGSSKIVRTPDHCAAVLGLRSGVACDNSPSCDTNRTLFIVPLLSVAPNALMGNSTNFIEGSTFGYNATALADFTAVTIASPGLRTDDPPRLNQSTDINGNGTGIDEVNFALTKAQEYFFYDIQTALTDGTTLIETFPTKRFSIADLLDNGPFNNNACIASNGAIGTACATPGVGSCDAFSCDTTVTSLSASGRCDTIVPTVYDDKENRPGGTTGFSPGTPGSSLKCDEVNLITVGSAGNAPVAASSTLVQTFKITPPSGFEMGWVKIDLTGTAPLRQTQIVPVNTARTTATMYGMPVIGYELQEYVTGALSHLMPMKYRTQVTFP